MLAKNDCIKHLLNLGISYDDAHALRRISMTLHRWHELECGDGNSYGSWAIVRGNKSKRVFKRDPESQAPMWEGGEFTHDDDGAPYLEYHHYSHGQGKDYVSYTRLADRERGALRRLAKIMANYSEKFAYYVQTDPRGASLYIIPRDRIQPDEQVCAEWLSCNYTRGVAVYK